MVDGSLRTPYERPKIERREVIESLVGGIPVGSPGFDGGDSSAVFRPISASEGQSLGRMPSRASRDGAK